MNFILNDSSLWVSSEEPLWWRRGREERKESEGEEIKPSLTPSGELPHSESQNSGGCVPRPLYVDLSTQCFRITATRNTANICSAFE